MLVRMYARCFVVYDSQKFIQLCFISIATFNYSTEVNEGRPPQLRDGPILDNFSTDQLDVSLRQLLVILPNL